jgi:two-component system OmpR family response regulator
MTKHVALVEDEKAIRENYSEALKKHGFGVSSFSDRRDAIRAFRQRLPDLAIIDIALGEEAEGGFDLCRELRGIAPTLPIIFLTARDSDFDVISGLRLGADDYLTKDVSMHQILARVAALFRRIDALQDEYTQSAVHRVGDLSIDGNCMRITWKEREITLTLTEFWILNSLARIPGHVKNRTQLMDDAKIFVDDGTITSHVKRIRRKFEAVDPDFECIETMYGMGYRWKK